MDNNSESRLRKLRKESGLSQKEFGKLFNVSEYSQKSYENGERNIPIEYAKKVCKKYNVTLDWLFNCSEDISDTMVNTILALEKVLRIVRRPMPTLDGGISQDLVLQIDYNFVGYLYEIKDLYRKCNTPKMSEEFSKSRTAIQEKYKEYLKQLFGEVTYERDPNKFKDIKDIELVELLSYTFPEQNLKY